VAEDVKKYIQRWGALQQERSTWISHWQEISAFLMPRNGRYFVSDRNRGWRRNNNIYDSTATRALNVLAAGMMGGMTSPARPWFRLSIPDQQLADHGPVKQWLSDCTKLMLWIFSDSNTYRFLHSQYRELGGFGTGGTILLDDYEDVINGYPLTTGEFCISQDYRGKVGTVYREFEKTVAQVVGEFGKDKCSVAVKRMYDSGNLDAWVPIIHAIEPRKDRDPNMRDAKNMAYASIQFERTSDGQLLRESGFEEFPGLISRWDVVGGDIYGHSPGMEALGDIKQLQHQQLRKAQVIDLQTKPPLQMPTSMKGRDIDTAPGGMSYIDRTSQGGGISTAFDVQLDLNALLADIQDVRQRIQASFFSDLFLMLANAQDTRMTATEVAERHEEKMLMLGPVIERLHDELLSPLIESTFVRMLKANIVPKPPQELQGMELKVEFVSMLAQAQRAIGTNSVDRFVGNIGQIAQFKPEVLDKFDSDEWADIYGDAIGVDPRMIVPSDKVAIIRQQRAQQQQQQAQLAAAEQASSAAANAAKVPTQGGASNAASDILNQYSGYNAPQAGAP
jgi:hypothetical protein